MWSDGSTSSRPLFNVPTAIQSGRSARQFNGKLKSKSGIEIATIVGSTTGINLDAIDFNIPSDASDPAGTEMDWPTNMVVGQLLIHTAVTNKTKDWALVQNVALVNNIEVMELG